MRGYGNHISTVLVNGASEITAKKQKQFGEGIVVANINGTKNEHQDLIKEEERAICKMLIREVSQ